MFNKLAGLEKALPTAKEELLEDICCRKYSTPIVIPDIVEYEGNTTVRYFMCCLSCTCICKICNHSELSSKIYFIHILNLMM